MGRSRSRGRTRGRSRVRTRGRSRDRTRGRTRGRSSVVHRPQNPKPAGRWKNLRPADGPPLEKSAAGRPERHILEITPFFRPKYAFYGK
jgi:hypothetical protein